MLSKLITRIDTMDISEGGYTKDVLISKHSSNKQVSAWLGREGFLLAQEKLTGINGKQLFALSKDELKDMIGFGEGVKLYSKLLRERDLLPSEYKTIKENDLERLLRLRREDIDSKTSDNPTTTFDDDEIIYSKYAIRNASEMQPERYIEKVKRKPVLPIEFTRTKDTKRRSDIQKSPEISKSREKSKNREKETSRDTSKPKPREKSTKQNSKSKESEKRKKKKSKKSEKKSSESEDSLSDSADSHLSDDSLDEKKRKSHSKHKRNKKKEYKESKSSKTTTQVTTSTSTQESQNFINHPFFQPAPVSQQQIMAQPLIRPNFLPQPYSAPPSSFLVPPLATAVNTPFMPAPNNYPYYGSNMLQQPWIGYGNL